MNNKLSWRRSLALGLSFLLVMIPGCLGSREPDEASYVLGIGVDKGTENSLEVTVYIANPGIIAGGTQGGDGQQQPGLMTSVQAPSIFGALTLLNSYISGELSLHHAKAIVFSEEIARQGLAAYIAPLVRYREIRTSMFVLVIKGKAKDFLASNRSALRTNPSKLFELQMESTTFTSHIPGTQLHDFYNAMKGLGQQPVATLVATQKKSGQSQSNEGSEDKGSSSPSKQQDSQKDREEQDIDKPDKRPPGQPQWRSEGSYIAGEIKKEGGPPVQIMGSAVFNGDKMLDELTGDETMLLLMLRGRFRRTFLTLKDLERENKFIVLDLRPGRPPRITVDVSPPRPKIRVKLVLEAELMAVESGINYERPALKKKVEKKLAGLIQTRAYQLVEKAQNQFRSDIFHFGTKARRAMATTAEWHQYNWPQQFPTADVHITTKVNIRRLGLISKTAPIPRTKYTGGLQ